MHIILFDMYICVRMLVQLRLLLMLHVGAQTLAKTVRGSEPESIEAQSIDERQAFCSAKRQKHYGLDLMRQAL